MKNGETYSFYPELYILYCYSGRRQDWNFRFLGEFVCWLETVWPAYTLITKYAKTIAKCEKQKVYSVVFHVTFLHFAPLFLFFAFCARVGIRAKSQKFRSLFFCGINKTQNLYELWKVYRECFVFRRVFGENIYEIPAKCEIRKVYSQPVKWCATVEKI